MSNYFDLTLCISFVIINEPICFKYHKKYLIFSPDATAESSETYKNPIEYENHPDPGALRINGGIGGFIVVSTSNYESSSETGPAFPILWSADLVSWNLVRK